MSLYLINDHSSSNLALLIIGLASVVTWLEAYSSHLNALLKAKLGFPSSMLI